MPNSTDTEVRVALINAMKSIKKTNGYTVDLPDANFRRNSDTKAHQRSEPSAYPKIFFSAGDVQHQREVSRRTEKVSIFYFVITALQSTLPGGDPRETEDQLEEIVLEIEKLVNRNSTLGGKVEEMSLLSVSYDSGFLHPEGVAVLELKTVRKVYNL